MTYEISVHAQDPSVGRVGVILNAIADASERAGGYQYLDVAVAYASTKGVRMLEERLSSADWTTARKRFLVSIDFGFTQPKALLHLCSFQNVEVRIPNGRAVLASATLCPPSAFHAKTFVFRGEQWFELRALVVGSANLTASALSTGAEVVTKQIWSSKPSEADMSHLNSAKPVLDWFEDAWANADLLSDVLDDYRLRHRRLPKPRVPPEEKADATRRYLASTATNVIGGILSVQLAGAKFLWVDGASIIRNRGRRRPGNQLNTPRGTRVFFGFDSAIVPKDTTLGMTRIRINGYAYVERSVRFANNSMDIIGLPIPEQYGVDSYLDTFLVFGREKPSSLGISQFTLTVTDRHGLVSLKQAAANSIELTMHGGRQYGLLF